MLSRKKKILQNAKSKIVLREKPVSSRYYQLFKTIPPSFRAAAIWLLLCILYT